MHSDVEASKKNQAPHHEPSTEALPPAPDTDEEDEVDDHTKDGRPRTQESSKNPHDYELIIDNDSGTYCPNAEYLPILRDLMQANLFNLRVATLDCQKDEEKMNRLKDEQKAKKKDSGKQITYLQNSSQSSFSSSDEEELRRRANGGKQSRLQKLGTEAKNVVGVVVPHRHHKDEAGNKGSTDPVVSSQGSVRNGVAGHSQQRPEPAMLQRWCGPL